MSRGRWKRGPHRNGAKPTRDAVLCDHDRDLLDMAILPEAMNHARKLQGLLPYTLPEVKPTVSAAMIFRLCAVLMRMDASKGIARYRAMQREQAETMAELREAERQLALCQREMRRWGLACPAPARQGELFAEVEA